MSCFETCKNARRKGCVDRYVFWDCEALADVAQLERIGESAFSCCFSLKSRKRGALVDVIFGDKLQSIGGCAFDNCRSLTRITIPLKDDMITHDSIFQDCRSLASVNLPLYIFRSGEMI
jgi:hypothetical protein